MDNKITPVSTYQLSENDYVVIINSNSKFYNINNVKLGVNIVVNRTQQSIKSIATLNAKNETFRSSQVLGDPMLLYHNQNKLVLAVEIDDSWDMLKNVQAILVYPELKSDINVTFEKKFVVVSGKLKEYAYIFLEGIESNKALKFNINVLFQKSMNDISLNKFNKIFLYNFDVNAIVENFVKEVYSTLLGRDATSSELKKYTQNLLNNTLSPTNFIINVVESSEFKVKKISNDDFITKIYKIILNREPDNDGKKYWSSEIDNSSRINVLKQMLKSEEYVRLMNEIGLKA